jgi:hypothetical protein
MDMDTEKTNFFKRNGFESYRQLSFTKNNTRVAFWMNSGNE